MFPSLTNLFEYLFNIHINAPVQTLGFFVIIAFISAYIVLSSEFKRKEALGLIHPIKREVFTGGPSPISELIVNAVLGFVFGFKVIGAIIDYAVFIQNPPKYLFSFHGNLPMGLLFSIGWFFWAYTARKKNQLKKPVVTEEVVHPYQLMIKISFWAGTIGFIGAKLLDTLEHINLFLANPVGDLLSTNGFAYYGAFLFGMITFFYIGVKNGMRLAHVSDVGAPGMMIAYGVGRIGCTLSGDGDWGIVNLYAKPHWLGWLPDWMWAFRFPHNVLNQGAYIPGCEGKYCNILPNAVYPTSFYEAIICIGMFIFLWLIRKHIQMPGLMSMLYLILAGTERFFIEFIKINIRYHLFGLTFTQAQFLSFFSIVIGLTGIIYMYTPVKTLLPKWLTKYFYAASY